MLKQRKYNLENFTYSYLHFIRGHNFLYSFCLTEHLTVKTNFELILGLPNLGVDHADELYLQWANVFGQERPLNQVKLIIRIIL